MSGYRLTLILSPQDPVSWGIRGCFYIKLFSWLKSHFVLILK